MFTVLVGKTCSGKTTIANELINSYKFKRIITYTTRPVRKGEKDGTDYHFISLEEFNKKVKEGFFAEWKSYSTIDGVWFYGTALEDLENADENTIVILTPNGYRDIKNKLKNKFKCIYVYANNHTIEKRLIMRGDNKDEAKRRLEHDNEDFKDFEYEADKIFYNNYETDINTVIERVLNFVR